MRGKNFFSISKDLSGVAIAAPDFFSLAPNPIYFLLNYQNSELRTRNSAAQPQSNNQNKVIVLVLTKRKKF